MCERFLTHQIAMPLTYQDLLIDLLLLLSVVELAVSLGIGALEARSKSLRRIHATAPHGLMDPFATWINMLERQKDRRDGLRYEGVERRSKIALPVFGSK